MKRLDQGEGGSVSSQRKALRDHLTAIAPAFSQKRFFMSDDFSLADCFMAPVALAPDSLPRQAAEPDPGPARIRGPPVRARGVQGQSFGARTRNGRRLLSLALEPMASSRPMTSSRPYLIRAVHEWIADNGLTPQMLVDAEVEGVVVPAHCVENGRIVLNVSASAVRGFCIGKDLVEFDARFSGSGFHVELPVRAVLALVARENGVGMFLPGREGRAAARAGGGKGEACSAHPASRQVGISRQYPGDFRRRTPIRFRAARTAAARALR